ncbi:MAG: CatB-related O-acetyltransferase [Gammaproteobacteria bacterium]|nr:CatB-related O-acetyltransferase [Gammaproteobacteria bacterium]
MYGPNPDVLHPLQDFPQVCFLKNSIDNPNIIVGDYTYYDDAIDAKNFERNVLYHYPFIGDKLIIGKYCSIARDVTFIMNGANHNMSGLSSYPFEIFTGGWQESLGDSVHYPYKGDTVIGNDVWIGYKAMIMPGVNIGDGSIIASGSVVSTDVAPYSIVAGNPSRLIRKRFSDEDIGILQGIKWWEWDASKLTRHLPYLVKGELVALQRALDIE